MSHSIKSILKTAGEALLLSACIAFTSCGRETKTKAPSIAVFIPGIMADSPTYAKLAEGVTEAVDAHNEALTQAGAASSALVKLTVMEAGTNQAEWATKLAALSATGDYDVIISSNESLPELCVPLTAQFPDQKFLLLHGALDGNPNIACVDYDQREQCYLTGYISALMSKNHKVALIAGQEYPAMNGIMLPYFARGASDAVAGTTCDFRIVGNWYDASKGSEIADALIQTGVDVILPICGGAAQGIISSAREHGIYLAYNDSGAFSKAPGTIISSCFTKQQYAARKVTDDFLNGKTVWGKTLRVGLQQGYIEFDDKNPLYISTVPQSVRDKMSELLQNFTSGNIEVPKL
ncbi:MAG: BMP family ABC transporter substrate-binding protein [Treponema sp.]|nr:BMP family ABC transporter substrate-binding protein [Treponema sp.]